MCWPIAFSQGLYFSGIIYRDSFWQLVCFTTQPHLWHIWELWCLKKSLLIVGCLSTLMCCWCDCGVVDFVVDWVFLCSWLSCCIAIIVKIFLDDFGIIKTRPSNKITFLMALHIVWGMQLVNIAWVLLLFVLNCNVFCIFIYLMITSVFVGSTAANNRWTIPNDVLFCLLENLPTVCVHSDHTSLPLTLYHS